MGKGGAAVPTGGDTPWGQMQPVDIANYNRGVWVSEAVTLHPVSGGVEGMSVRHGLKEGGVPMAFTTWRGMPLNGWRIGTIGNTIQESRRIPLARKPERKK